MPVREQTTKELWGRKKKGIKKEDESEFQKVPSKSAETDKRNAKTCQQ